MEIVELPQLPETGTPLPMGRNYQGITGSRYDAEMSFLDDIVDREHDVILACTAERTARRRAS